MALAIIRFRFYFFHSKEKDILQKSDYWLNFKITPERYASVLSREANLCTENVSGPTALIVKKEKKMVRTYIGLLMFNKMYMILTVYSVSKNIDWRIIARTLPWCCTIPYCRSDQQPYSISIIRYRFNICLRYDTRTFSETTLTRIRFRTRVFFLAHSKVFWGREVSIVPLIALHRVAYCMWSRE